ncbi:hypothetical protein B0T18DRAFT_292571, partial [Schizothecium vesticola]
FKPRARPAHTKRHRVARSLHDDSSSSRSGSSDDDDERARRRQHKVQAITTYGDDSGSEGEMHDAPSSSKHPRRDDDKSNRRGHNDQPQSHDRSPSREGAEEPEKQPPVKWGLTINMKGAGKPKDPPTKTSTTPPTKPPTTKRPLTLDDEALESLIDASSHAPKRSKPTTTPDGPDSEPRLEDYRALPIDDFGAHLLRGFGWDGQLKGKVKEVDRRRANLTGLGAKGDVKGAEDLGAWNQKSGAGGGGKPVRLEDYRREEGKRRERRDARERDSYKREKERERGRDGGREKER